MPKSKTAEKDNLISRSGTEVVRDFFNVGKVKRLFRFGSEVLNAVQPFLEAQTPLNAVKAVFHVGKIVVDDMEIWPDDYFDDNWDSPYGPDFNKLLLQVFSGKPYKVIKTSDETHEIRVVVVNGVQFGYVLNTKSDNVDRIYVELEHIEKAKKIVKEELWRLMKDENVVLRHVRRQKASGDFDTVAFEADDAFRPMPSKRASEYAVYLRKCVDAGVSRSVMLYGPPGTGKSTMARTIVDNLGMKSFRIRVEDIAHLENSTIFEAINIFEPDAVILDDFDRSGSQESLLETLEFFQRHVKLVIATVNDKRRLDEAILRPGRFDELLHIKQMDDDVVKAVLGDEHAEAYDLVNEWPIAFIQEYVKRRRFMTMEEAEMSIKELAQRVKRLSKYEEDEEDDVSEADRVLLTSSNDHEETADEKLDDFFRTASKMSVKLKKRYR